MAPWSERRGIRARAVSAEASGAGNASRAIDANRRKSTAPHTVVGSSLLSRAPSRSTGSVPEAGRGLVHVWWPFVNERNALEQQRGRHRGQRRRVLRVKLSSRGVGGNSLQGDVA